jgi:hypothetical protein
MLDSILVTCVMTMSRCGFHVHFMTGRHECLPTLVTLALTFLFAFTRVW